MKRFVPCVVAALALGGGALRSDAAPNDEAARGIDLFVHAPSEAASGAAVEVLVEALGFPTITSLTPLAGAEVEASWDPETLGDDATVAPAGVRATADAGGRARLVVPMPEGAPRDLSLLIAARAHGRERVRTLKVHRGLRARIGLHVVDRHVVPGSFVSAWVVATSAATGDAIPRAPIEVALLEGGQARESVRATTDAAGTAAVRLHVPRTDEPVWAWTLRASLAGASDGQASAAIALSPREESPGTPHLAAAWEPPVYVAGERARYRLRLRDATDQPLAGTPISVWVGPHGTHAPKDDKAWQRIAPLITDARGEVAGELDAPRIVVRGAPTSLELVARSRVEGRELEARAVAAVGAKTSAAELTFEASQIVPGVEQRALLRVLDARNEPVRGPFRVEADGLAAEVATDAHGEAEITWRPPSDLGARRNVGPCAGGVAATIRLVPLGESTKLVPEPIDLCVAVDTDAPGLLLVDRTLVRAGDLVHVAVRARDARAKNDAWSIVLTTEEGARAATAWMPDGERGVDLAIPAGAPGWYSIAAASPKTTRTAPLLSRSVVVAPRTLGELRARVGGRAAPGGTVDVEADLSDGRGTPLTGTVAAVLVDLHGGGDTRQIESFDTRVSLCTRAGVSPDRCRGFFDGDASFDPLRRAAAAVPVQRPRAPALDPGSTAKAAMEKVFADVVKSLEGAVFEAATSPDLAREVRRRDARGFAFNPELLTLVTAAMEPAPTTPGGEPVALADLLAVDGQVTFDHVARRVTRLKLFRVLERVRTFRHDSGLMSDEPIFRDPNAILQRLVREGSLSEAELVDAWGGTMRFTRSSGPPAPFLSVVRGFELHSPGPDGVLGTADDVRDPFERVLRSGSPYAVALHEDRIVSAALDAEVGDATVSAWQQMFDELTGTALGLKGTMAGGGGRGEGFGMGGMGSIGHGSGYGRGSLGESLGGAFWSEPVRTDARGHVTIHVPLGDAETTWRVALVAIPDAGAPATTTVDVATFLPYSVRVEAGAGWAEHDTVEARVVVRNRSDQPARLTLRIAAGGVLETLQPERSPRVVDVPAYGANEVSVRVRAKTRGHATLDVELREHDSVVDKLEHAWEVGPAAEPTELTEAKWVAESEELAAPLERGMVVSGAARVVIERGYETALASALESLEPDRLASPDAVADAIEVAFRVHRFAVNRYGEASPLAVRARSLGDRAHGKLVAFQDSGATIALASKARAVIFGGDRDPSAPRPTSCPPELPFRARVALLEAEPISNGTPSGVALACWDAFVSTTLAEVDKAADPLVVSEALLAIAERPHRVAAAAALVDRLREIVALRPSGAVSLPPFAEKSRAARATIFAALLRAQLLGKRSVAPAERLAAWVRVQEDADGGYGSAAATRAVVRALLATTPESAGPSEVTVVSGGVTKAIHLGASERAVVELERDAVRARVDVKGAAVLARFERHAERPWSHPPDDALSPLKLEASWPDDARAASHGVLRLSVRHGFEARTSLDLRVPLPPGVSLAESVEGVRQVHGALLIRRSIEASLVPTLVEVPVRFGLAGAMRVPEATARASFEESSRAVAPSRPIVIR